MVLGHDKSLFRNVTLRRLGSRQGGYDECVPKFFLYKCWMVVDKLWMEGGKHWRRI